MTEDPEQAEGQTLATDILHALNRAATGIEKPDWSLFVKTYEADLTTVASALQRRYRGLNGFEPMDIVQEFLVAKVFPPTRARVLLEVVARGTQPLKPRLLQSIGTFCIDLHRSGLRQPASWGKPPDIPTTPKTAPTAEEVESLLSRQLLAIRAAFELAPTRAPYRETLLLCHRIEWAWVLSGTLLAGTTGVGEVSIGVDRVVALTRWTTDENCQVFGEGETPKTLHLAWDQLSGFIGKPGHVLTGERIAEILGIPRERWDGWISRGRQRLKTHLGGNQAYGLLFPTWTSTRM